MDCECSVPCPRTNADSPPQMCQSLLWLSRFTTCVRLMPGVLSHRWLAIHLTVEVIVSLRLCRKRSDLQDYFYEYSYYLPVPSSFSSEEKRKTPRPFAFASSDAADPPPP